MPTLRALPFVLTALLVVPAAAGADAEQDMQQLAAASHLAGLVLAVVPAVFVCGAALVMLTVLLAPGVTDRGAARVQATPFRSFLLGLPVLVALLILGKSAERVHALNILNLPLFVVLTAGGTAAVAQDLGRRVYALADRSGSRLGRLLAGWALYISACLIPVLGWFVVSLILFSTGIGAFLHALFTRPPSTTPAAPSEAAAKPS